MEDKLDKSIAAHASISTASYVQLSTIRPNGRPANRTVVFRGFWNPADRALFEEANIIASGNPKASISDASASMSPQQTTPHTTSLGSIRSASLNELDSKKDTPLYNRSNNGSHPTLSSSSIEERGNHIQSASSSNWLVAAKLAPNARGWMPATPSAGRTIANDMNRRMLHIGQALAAPSSENADGHFAEVCWYFPETREQYRLSGRLYLVAAPKSGISTHPPWAPRDTPFERERRRLWRKISPSLRATFTGSIGAPGTPYPKDITDPRRLERLDSLLSEEDEDDIEMVESPAVELPPQAQNPAEQDVISIHDEAFARFGLLLLDVEDVDYVDLKGSVENRDGVRMQYRIVVPERTYGRITGLKWEEKRVIP
ncbi:hypothetical protein BC829DRAFT_459130 [Chytridium lagenaria]|nr:hypothetical protein BC829DRAFT_459130 [Chytridium lagenaria]